MSFVDPWGAVGRSSWQDPLGDVTGASAPPIPTPGKASEHIYLGLSATNNPETVDLDGMHQANVGNGETEAILPWGPSIAGEFLIVLAPQPFGVLSLFDPRFPANQIDAFTMKSAARKVDDTDFDSWVAGPLNPGLIAQMVISDTA